MWWAPHVDVLRLFDDQLRDRLAPGEESERVGPVLRNDRHGFIGYRDLGGLDGAGLDAFIAAQRDHFAARQQRFEWKYYAHDLPKDLPERLTAAGLRPDPPETVMIGAALPLAAPPQLPPGVRLREVTTRADLERIRAMKEVVWGTDLSWLPDTLERELSGDGDTVVVVVAEAGDDIVCGGWIRFHDGTDFASLWGGSTHPDWRRKGIYRATVAYRAGLAVDRGFRYLQVDASDDSRPILERLGMRPVATTVPYLWRPEGS